MRPGALADAAVGFGEPELDANAALTELDKGYHVLLCFNFHLGLSFYPSRLKICLVLAERSEVRLV
jgi:hypothetical protein